MKSDDFLIYAFGFLVAVFGLSLFIWVVVSITCQLYGGCYYPQASIELKGEIQNAGSSGNN